MLAGNAGQLLLCVDGPIEPVAFSNFSDSGSHSGINIYHASEEILEVFTEEVFSLLEVEALLGPIFRLIRLLKEIEIIDSIVNIVFNVRKGTSGLEYEEKDSKGVDISGGGVLAGTISDFGSSVVFGTLADDSLVLLGSEGKVKIGNFCLVIVANKDVVGLDVKMVDIVVVEVLNSVQELVEIGSDEFFILEKVSVVEDSIGKGSVLSEFHKND